MSYYLQELLLIKFLTILRIFYHNTTEIIRERNIFS